MDLTLLSRSERRQFKSRGPEENDLMERANRTLDDALEEELTHCLQAVKAIARNDARAQRAAFAQGGNGRQPIRATVETKRTFPVTITQPSLA